MRVPLVSIAMALAVAACGSDEVSVSTATSVEASPTSTSVVSTTIPEPTPTSTTPSAPATTTPKIDVEFVDGEVIGPDVLEAALGESVDIWIRSDIDDEMHVHGYDLVYDLEAGVPFHLSFVADVPGIFEVEVHTGHTILFELRVSG